MTKKSKIILISVFVAIVVILAGVAAYLNFRPTTQGGKNFQIEIVSDRDSFSEVKECNSDAEYLGEFLRTYEDCEYEESEYGIYITGFAGMEQDLDNQYWWCVSVNGENSTLGADEIPLQEGEKYTFTLTQGW